MLHVAYLCPGLFLILMFAEKQSCYMYIDRGQECLSYRHRRLLGVGEGHAVSTG